MSNSLWSSFSKRLPTSGIGSLPHPYVDAALSLSFRMDIPFLPQLPAKNAREFMVIQALDGLPGLTGDETGLPQLDGEAWQKGKSNLRKRTDVAFAQADKNPLAFETFEPSPEAWSCWNPFLFELEERQTVLAKIQLAGPLTCQWSLQRPDLSAEANSELTLQVYRLALARSMAMIRRLKAQRVTPLFFLDEPAFYSYSPKDPIHTIRFQELRLFVQTLKKERALVGLHCCSNTDWQALLGLSLDVLSLDTQLSLTHLLSHREAVKRFLDGGGRFSLGVIPTGVQPIKIQAFDVELAANDLKETLKHFEADERILETAIITPACGLALHAVEDANRILDATRSVADRLRK